MVAVDIARGGDLECAVGVVADAVADRGGGEAGPDDAEVAVGQGVVERGVGGVGGERAVGVEGCGGVA